MNLYIDESGNTGYIGVKEGKLNFEDQPYYTLAGLLVAGEKEADFRIFINKCIGIGA